MKTSFHFKHRSAWLRATCLFFLVATVVLAIPPRQEKKQILQDETTQKGGFPDTLAQPGVPASRQVILRKSSSSYPIDPHTAYPPYNPVAMGVDFGTTGLTTYTNSNGIALIDPGRNVLSPILLNEYDYTIDPETGYPIGGKLGSEGGGRFDLVINQAGTLAVVSNFGDSTIYFVDLSTGTPVVDGKVKIDFFAEDIDFDPTGTWLLCTDGGFSPRIARIHVPTRTWVPAGTEDADDDPATPETPYSWRFPTELVDTDHNPATPDEEVPVGYANAVAIAADGRTVVCADYFSGYALVLTMDPATGDLTYQQRFMLWREGTDGTGTDPFLYRPVNVSISPDGRTVLFANAGAGVDTNDVDDPPNPAQYKEGSNVAVLRIDSPGHCTRMPDVIMPWLVRGGQSIAFSRDGSQAYYETNHWVLPEGETTCTDAFQDIQILSVNGPGLVTRSGAIPMLTTRGTSQLFGVDTLATSPDGNFLYVTNPTVSGGQPVVEVVDLNRRQSVKQITCPLDYPDPLRSPYPDPVVLPPDPGDPGDWIPILIPTGIAFPEGPIDLGLQLQLDQTQASIGEEFTFRLVVTNGSVSPAFGVRVGSLLPAGVEIVSASADRGNWDAGNLRWTINGLKRRGQATLTIRAKASTQGDKLLGAKINGQAGYDPRTANNRAEATIQISMPADLALTAQPASGTYQTQVAFPVELTARNLGPQTAGQVTVTQNLPAGWTVSGATASQGAYDTVTGSWTIGELVMGASATLRLQLKGSNEGTAVLAFAIDDAATGDPVTGNDQALVTLTMVKAAPPQQAKVERLTNDLVFSQEYINQLSWQHNPVNVSFTGYRIRRKAKGAADASYVQLAEVGATVTQYADRQLASDQLFTYKITAVTSRGEESLPVIVGN